MAVVGGDVPLVHCSGLESQRCEEDVVDNGGGLSRGDRRRNERIERLRAVVPAGNAILGIDLADEKQALVLTDHDSRVLARRSVTAKAWALDPLLGWGEEQARRRGFAGVTVACEPTGHRWRVVDRLAAERGVPMVCVQPLLVGRSGESEDYTRDRRDEKDAVLIARLVGQLHCYVPERAEETWARLRHLGALPGRGDRPGHRVRAAAAGSARVRLAGGAVRGGPADGLDQLAGGAVGGARARQRPAGPAGPARPGLNPPGVSGGSCP